VGAGVVRLRPTLVSAAVVAAGLMLPALAYGWQGNINLLTAWWATVTGSRRVALVGGDSVSMAAMWGKWLGVGTTATALAALSGLVLLGLAAFVRLRRRAVETPGPRGRAVDGAHPALVAQAGTTCCCSRRRPWRC
jgi:hypothetical protein